MAAGATTSAEALGGAGALIIGGTVFPHMFAVIAAALIGGVLVGGIVCLVQKLWSRHNIKALKYLDEIFHLDILLILFEAQSLLYVCNYSQSFLPGS